MALLLQLYGNKVAENPTQDIENALVVVLGIDKHNLQRRALRVIKAIAAAGYNMVIPNELVLKLKNSSDREIIEMINELYR